MNYTETPFLLLYYANEISFQFVIFGNQSLRECLKLKSFITVNITIHLTLLCTSVGYQIISTKPKINEGGYKSLYFK